MVFLDIQKSILWSKSIQVNQLKTIIELLPSLEIIVEYVENWCRHKGRNSWLAIKKDKQGEYQDTGFFWLDSLWIILDQLCVVLWLG